MQKKSVKTEKKTYPRLQSKVVKRWKEKYLQLGVDISFCRFGHPTWQMKSSNVRFVVYQCCVEIDDITKLEENMERFKREYPSLLRADIDRMLEAYPDDRRIKEDGRMYLRLFGKRK